MTAPKTIRVTADHIASGKKSDSCCCPIALALAQQMGIDEPMNVFVGPEVVQVLDGPSWHSLDAVLPPVAQHFILQFDRGEPVQPFEFEAEWIDGEGLPA